MNCKIHIHLLNELFSQELADAKHGGKESADNLRYDWEDELDITSAVTLVQEQTDALFSYEIPAMHLFEIHCETDPITYVGASQSIVDHCTYSSDSNGHTIRIFLKDYEPMANPVPGIFIASKAFPKALIR